MNTFSELLKKRTHIPCVMSIHGILGLPGALIGWGNDTFDMPEVQVKQVRASKDCVSAREL